MLSEQLKAIRKANGFTQVELSKVIGIERSTYASYETGRNRPDISLLEKIAKACGVTVDSIISIDVSKPLALGDNVKDYNDKTDPRTLGDLTPDERAIISRLRVDPSKVSKVEKILFEDK